MYVLQTAVAIVWRNDAKIGRHGRTPSLRQILHAEPPLQQVKFEPEAQHDVKVVGHLIGVGPDQRTRHFVNGAMKRRERNMAELFRKRLLRRRIEIFPEPVAARDNVLPKPGLAFMHAGRDALPERYTVQRRTHALLVHPMPCFMQGTHFSFFSAPRNKLGHPHARTMTKKG